MTTKIATFDPPARRLHYPYAERMTVILASVGVVTVTALGVASHATVSPGSPIEYPWPMMVLYFMPLIAGICAGSALILDFLAEKLPTEQKALTLVSVGKYLDFIWWGLSLAVLAAYVTVLVFPVQLGITPAYGVTNAGQAQDLLSGYFFGISAFAAASLPGLYRYYYLFISAAMVAALPGRLGILFTKDGLSAALFMVCFNLLVMLGVSLVLARAKNLDIAQQKQCQAHIALVEENARLAATRSVNEYVHDHVLSALSAVSLSKTNTKSLRQAAGAALDLLLGNTTIVEVSSGEGLVEALHEQKSDVDITISQAAAQFRLPPEAGRALLAATVESIRNAHQHGRVAGEPPPRVVVTLNVRGGRLEILVTDDGKGFNPDSPVLNGRFGIEQGIYIRTEQAGGSATITSAPSESKSEKREQSGGTQVKLSWPAVVEEKTSGQESEVRSEWLDGIDDAMDTHWAAITGAFILVCYAVIIQLNAGSYSSFVPSAVFLGMGSLAAFLLLFRREPWQAAPKAATAVILVVLAVGNYWVLSTIIVTGWPGYAAWTLGFSTMLACGMLMRKQTVAAWLSVGLLLVTTTIWAAQSGSPLSTAIVLVAGQVVTLTFWTIMVFWSTRAVDQLTAVQVVREQAENEQLLRTEVRDRVTRKLTSVADRTKPLLRDVAAGAPITDRLRQEARLLEAELRDEIRGASFTGTPVVIEARRARARGVEVVLLDDSGAEGPANQVDARFLDQAVQQLRAVTSGRVVIRLLPSRSGASGSGATGTIVTPTDYIAL